MNSQRAATKGGPGEPTDWRERSEWHGYQFSGPFCGAAERRRAREALGSPKEAQGEFREAQGGSDAQQGPERVQGGQGRPREAQTPSKAERRPREAVGRSGPGASGSLPLLCGCSSTWPAGEAQETNGNKNG